MSDRCIVERCVFTSGAGAGYRWRDRARRAWRAWWYCPEYPDSVYTAQGYKNDLGLTTVEPSVLAVGTGGEVRVLNGGRIHLGPHVVIRDRPGGGFEIIIPHEPPGEWQNDD